MLSKRSKYIISIGLLIGGLIIGYLSLIHFGTKISKEAIQELFEGKSEGKYRMIFTELEISLVDSQLDITGLRIEPTDSYLMLPDSIKEAVYNVSIPKISIGLNSLQDVFLHKRLSFNHFSVTDPSIGLERLAEGKKKQSISLEAGELYKIIDDYLVEFSVDSLGIHQATIDYRSMIKTKEAMVFIDQINLILRDFEIDSTSENGQFLLTGGFSLHLTDQSFLLRDSLHIASFKKFSLSTAKKEIVIDDFKLIQRADKSYDSKSNLNKYDIRLPKTYFRGLDFEQAYETNALQIDNVVIENPIVKIEQKKTNNKESSNNLPLLISRLFNSVDIGKLKVNNATTMIKMDYGKKNQAFTFEKSSMEVTRFHLDSAFYDEDKDDNIFEHISFESFGNSIRLPDSSHVIKFNKILLSSLDSLSLD